MKSHETYNMTPFVAELAITKDLSGKDLMVAILKASFDFDPHGNVRVSPRDRTLKVMLSDQFADTSENSSVTYPSDLTPCKDGTDIIINGHAYGHNRKQIRCGFKLGRMKKMLRVSGERCWIRLLRFYKITAPIPFDKIPLTYANAFGGRYEDDRGVHLFEYNPLGKGFGAKYRENAPLPMIEYENDLIQSVNDRVRPAGFGALPATWKQRLVYAGTYDDAWKRKRCPMLPLDMNPKYYNAAPADQIFSPKLKGSEKLTLFRLHPFNPELSLIIPKGTFTCTARIKTESFSSSMSIDTCLIEPDKNRLILTYISRFPLLCDAKYLKSVHFEEI